MALADSIHRTAVVGAGQMGHGIAQSFAQAGYPVMLHDVSEARVQAGLASIERNLDAFRRHGLITRQATGKTLALISPTTDLEEATAGVDYVQEAVFEDPDIKRRLYADLEAVCRESAIIASNTSGMMPTQLAAKMVHPERFLVAHFWKPPYLVKLVEVVPGQRTAPDLAEQVCDFLRSAKKKPVIVRKEVPGYIGNRIQYAMIREATHIVQEGIASPEDVDLSIVEGFGIRFSFAGIFHIMDLAGLDLTSNIASYLLADLGNERGVPEVIAARVAAGQLGARTGRGFYEWTPESLAEIYRVWDEALVRQLRRHEQEP